jgi:lauroyl/myristoyl acyltransferase
LEVISTQPKNVRFVRRAARVAIPRRTISLADLATALRLMGSLVIAWLLPQNWWPYLARKTSWFGQKLAGKTMTAVTSRMTPCFRDADDAMRTRLAADLCAARYEVAFQCLRGYRPGGWHPKITVQGREHINAALLLGKGCVLWVAHFVFSPNATKVGLDELGYRVSHLSRPDHGFSSTEFGIRYLNPLRSKFEDAYLSERIVFDRSHPAPALLRARKIVGKNGIVSFTAGAWEGSSVVEAGFLGHRATLAMGPVWLARTSGAVLLPVFALRTKAPNEFAVEIDSAIEVSAAQSAPQCMVEAATSFLMRHETHLLKYPGQWRGWSSLQDA